MNVENLTRYYSVMLREGQNDAFLWAFCAGLSTQEEDGINRVYVYGAAADVENPTWHPISIAAVDESIILDGTDENGERALVCAITAQVLDDLAELSEDPESPAQLQIIGYASLSSGASVARQNASDLLESREVGTPLTALEEAVWDILAGASID